MTVTCNYPGANAKTVAETVATPIEEQINGVEGMIYMSSQSTNDGTMMLTVTFKLGTNLDIAQVQVQNRVAIAQPLLPLDVQRAGIVVKKASPNITLGIAVYSPDESRDPLYLSNYVTLQVKDELARLPGVGDMTIFGARDYSMRLWLNPEQLASRHLIAGDVITAVQEQNVQVAAGIVGGPPLPAGKVPFQYTINAQGRLVEPKQFGEIVIKTGADGSVTRLKDVARVDLGAADYTTNTHYNGLPAVGIGVFQLPGSNSIATANAIYKKLAELKANFPVRRRLRHSLRYHHVRSRQHSRRGENIVRGDRARGTRGARVSAELAGGDRAAAGHSGFDHRHLRGDGGLRVLAQQPVDVRLVLAIGIVVDDAIVVVENVDRWIEQGLSPRDATYRAMEEVTPAVIAIACGLTAVFVPVAFISGITGQFYQQFALTISFSTLLSAFNSLTLSPALAALDSQAAQGQARLAHAHHRSGCWAGSSVCSTSAWRS